MALLMVNDARNERSLTIILKRMRRSHRIWCTTPTYRKALSLPLTRAFNYGYRESGYSAWVIALTTVVDTTSTKVHLGQRLNSCQRKVITVYSTVALSIVFVMTPANNDNSSRHLAEGSCVLFRNHTS